jgi:ABC-type sugar transport system, permease component
MTKRLTGGDIVFNCFNYLIFSLFALICISPFYYIFINTVSDNTLVDTGKIILFPKGIQINNYIDIFRLRNLGHSAMISLARTVVGTLIALIASSFPGYALSKTEFWHKKFWYRFFIITMYFNAGIIPWYLMMKALLLTNNFWGYVLPALVGPFNIVLVKTYVESIPASLEEVAEIDGAGYLKRYLYVILPLTTPIIATIAVFAAVGQWNAFMDTVMLMKKSSLLTLQYLLYQYLNEVNAIATMMKTDPAYASQSAKFQLNPSSVRMTISMVTIFPILFVYPFFQRYFIKGIMLGAIKG